MGSYLGSRGCKRLGSKTNQTKNKEMAGRLGFTRSRWFQTQHEEESSRAGRLFKAAKIHSQGKGATKSMTQYQQRHALFLMCLNLPTKRGWAPVSATKRNRDQIRWRKGTYLPWGRLSQESLFIAETSPGPPDGKMGTGLRLLERARSGE